MRRTLLREVSDTLRPVACGMGLDGFECSFRRSPSLGVRWERPPDGPFRVIYPDLMDGAPAGVLCDLGEELMRRTMTASPFRMPDSVRAFLSDPSFALAQRCRMVARDPHLAPMDWRMEQARLSLQQMGLDCDAVLFVRRTDGMPSSASRVFRTAMVSASAPEDPDALGAEMWRLACACLAGFGPGARAETERLMRMHPAFAEGA